jgi:predicted metal-dependent hydrolase
MENNTLAMIGLACVVGYLVYDTYWQGNTERVEAMLDGNDYVVQDRPDKQQAAELLANIRTRLDTLMKHLEKMYPSDERVERLLQNFDSERIMEGPNESKYTSYSINKGEKIVLCLRDKKDKEENNLMDLNTMMFVTLHEVAHIATKSVGHTEEFWDNFKWLLEESMNIGLYVKQEFEKKPVPYCGMNITSTPLN